MACSLYNNNGFGCGGCEHFVRTNSVTLVGSVLVLNIPQETYSNKEKVCICIAQALPDVIWNRNNTVPVNNKVWKQCSCRPDS